MDIVLAHNNMDLDALAAQLAVTKLYPGTRMLPGYPLVGNVRQFLALYRDNLPLSQIKYLDLNKVRHVFIVDCQQIGRLDETARKLISDPSYQCTYTLFDHHTMDPSGLGPGSRSDSIVKPVGSTTTILVEQIRDKKIALTPFEATLLTIGIYEDTGCLTYLGTTALDAECVAFLLSQGADIARVNDYIHPKASDEQVRLLEQLLRNCKIIEILGSRVVIATASLPAYLDGLATMTRKIVEVESADAAFSIVAMKDRVHLVGRSDSKAIDVRKIMRHFGGDGHAGAGSAVTRNNNIEELTETILGLLDKQVHPQLTASDIMTSPVRTILTSTTMEEAGRIMLRYGLDGLVVVDKGDMVGVVSKRDIDQATHHKLGHAPVLGFMSKPVITISPNTPLGKIQEIMIKEDIGRLPVQDDNKELIGIVGRQEVLRTLYGGKEKEEETKNLASNSHHHEFKDKLEQLDAPKAWLFKQIGLVAARLNMSAYAVGGCVRDLFLARPNYDLDFVIEGSAIELAQALEETFPGRLQLQAKHDRFKTATLLFQAAEPLEIDLSTARMEYYEYPAALPTVEASSLKQDLFRRDFTVNALALCLNPGQYAEVVDYFDGLKDLDAKLIRVLHPFSFIEDPTRIVRAARFAARFGFKLESKTKQQAQRAITMGIFDDLAGVRMRTEIRLILESPQRLKALDILGELGGKLRYLDSELEYGDKIRKLLRRAERLLERFDIEDAWVVYFGVLLSQLKPARRNTVLDRLQLSNNHKDDIERGLTLTANEQAHDTDLKPSQIVELLHGHSPRAMAIAASVVPPGSPLRRMVKLYLEKLRYINPELTGSDLIKLGVPQGPGIGKIMNDILQAKLDGEIADKEQELKFVDMVITNFAKPGCG